MSSATSLAFATNGAPGAPAGSLLTGELITAMNLFKGAKMTPQEYLAYSDFTTIAAQFSQHHDIVALSEIAKGYNASQVNYIRMYYTQLSKTETEAIIDQRFALCCKKVPRFLEATKYYAQAENLPLTLKRCKELELELREKNIKIIAAKIEVLETPSSNKKIGVCLTCKNPQADLKCARCKVAFYCGAKCQKEDWKNHKITCKKAE